MKSVINVHTVQEIKDKQHLHKDYLTQDTYFLWQYTYYLFLKMSAELSLFCSMFNVYSVGTCVLTLSAEQACAHTQRAVSTEQVDSRVNKRTLYIRS